MRRRVPDFLDSVATSVVQSQTTAARHRLEFWESERTRPDFVGSSDATADLIAATNSSLDTAMKHPYLPVSEIRAQQFARVRQLVELAYREIPVYRCKYQAAGFARPIFKNGMTFRRYR